MIGKEYPNLEMICSVKVGRNILTDRDHCLILCSIKELEKIIKEAKKTKKMLKEKKIKVGLFYKHLAPDVSFGFVCDDGHKWLKG
jgi:exopolysaccharide biosynthesis predicted pyruvyltransferase EpsI